MRLIAMISCPGAFGPLSRLRGIQLLLSKKMYTAPLVLFADFFLCDCVSYKTGVVVDFDCDFVRLRHTSASALLCHGVGASSSLAVS